MGCCGSTPTPQTKPPGNSYQQASLASDSTLVNHGVNANDRSIGSGGPSFNYGTDGNSGHQPAPTQPPPQLPDSELPPASSSVLFVALFDYDARVPEDLDFKKGDLLEVVNSEDPNWWLTRHMRTQKEGFIPSNFVAISQSIDAQP